MSKREPTLVTHLASPIPYDALLIVSFGGPEGPDDVLPFLENVTRGRNVPRERLLEVAGHYRFFGGVSPLNGEIRAMLAKLVQELNAHGRTCRSTGETATGIRCSATRCGKWPTTAPVMRWHWSLRPSAPTELAGNTGRTSPAREEVGTERREST